ncbi:hypothetical protein C8R45DRAFT_1097648 [Mycena sanguinolenta]|nr:hypothetical protein C8R45DRAFT_1097648 [Mycena sanguinolenta]
MSAANSHSRIKSRDAAPTSRGWLKFQAAEWPQFAPLLSTQGFSLYSFSDSSAAFHTAPLNPHMLPALSPFDPQDGEDFVWRHIPRVIRTPPGMWRQPTPATNLALDAHTREVMIKAVPPGSSEAQILERLASPTLREHHENHTIPVVSIIHCERASFLVQAHWGGWWIGDAPCTLSFWAGVQAVQLLEGLAFMHETSTPATSSSVVCNFNQRRTLPAPCRVFEAFKKSGNYRVAFIDFGQAIQFAVDSSSSSHGHDSCASHGLDDAHHRTTSDIRDGLPPDIGPPHAPQMRTEPPHPRIQIPTPRPIRGPPNEFRAPEIDSCATYDPFAADVFSLARLLLDLDLPMEIPADYQALLEKMTDEDPGARPSARGALEQLKALNETHSADWV